MQGDNFCAQMHVPVGFRTLAPDLKVFLEVICYHPSLTEPEAQTKITKNHPKQSSIIFMLFMARHHDMPFVVSGTSRSFICITMFAPFPHIR